MKKIFIAAALFVSYQLPAQKLHCIQKIRTQVPEPSDIVYTQDFSGFYSVSDQGVLFRTDTNGHIIQKAKHTGTDFEGVYADDQFVYVTDERNRSVLVYSADQLTFIKQYQIPYLGAANEGYEGITFNQKKKCFVLCIEKNPVSLVELNEQFQQLGSYLIPHVSDLSSLCYYNNFLYALSDEDEKVLKLDPISYAVLSSWKIPVTNPEGICFDKQGHLVIQSDKDQKIYKFDLSHLPL